MSPVIRGANHNPRRWTDATSKVRVIEGWHPSRPGRLGYNLIVEGEWIGTFETLDEAADAATPHLPSPPQGDNRPVALLPFIDPGSRGTT
jgi:hypothetical protein